MPSQPTWSVRYSGTCTSSRSENTPIHSTVMIVYARLSGLSCTQSSSQARRCSVGSVRMNSTARPSAGTRTISEIDSRTM